MAAMLEMAGESMLRWLSPGLENVSVEKRLTASWTLARFSDVSAIVVVYLLFSVLVPFFSKGRADSSLGATYVVRNIEYDQEEVSRTPETRSSEPPTPVTKSASSSPLNEIENDKPLIRRDGLSNMKRRELILHLQNVYDVLQIFLSAYVGMLGVQSLILSVPHCPLVFYCRRSSFSLSAAKSLSAEAWHAFYWLKVLDLADTVFIVVRKKWQQLSFLHVYHHASMLFFCWIMLNGGFADDIIIGQICNCFVHVLMYLYYLLRGLEIRVPTPLKALLTAVQMTQFLILSSHSIFGILLWYEFLPSLALGALPACPRRLVILELVYQIVMFVLFQEFARRTYGSRRSEASKRTTTKAAAALKNPEKVE